jgi:hypothetical protein
VTKHYEEQGEKVYFIPMGGSNELGCLGYYECAIEMAEQIKGTALEGAHVVSTVGSMGTYMGLFAAIKNEKLPMTLTGIAILQYKNIIDFGHINIYDNEGHTGHISGKIKHNYFQDINLDLDINVNNMLVMNTTRNDIESFYGKVYGSGNAKISGDQKEIKITCNARSNKGTSVIIPIDNYYASENSFIIFQDNNNLTSNEIIKNTTINDENNTNIILDLMLEITPDAHLDLIIDSKAGDMITGNGNGNLRVTYDINADDMKIYGNVQIEQGKYLFTFQNVLRKEFFVKEGSSLVWTGDPLGADLHIDAYYQLTADLAEILDEAILSNTSRTSVPVQCLLNLTGLLTHPNIKFNLNLPNSEEDVSRRSCEI